MLGKFLYENQNVILVFLISLVLCLIGSGAYPIYILDEAKNTEAAREMMFGQEYIVPTFNGVLRTDKPPLHYYFMMIGYNFFGINSFGARFFSGIFGTLTIVFSFHFINFFSGKNVAYTFALITWSSIFFIQEFHLAVPDPYLIFFISTGLWFFYDFYIRDTISSLWFMYILFGFGALTKGPVALLLPGLICLVFFIITKDLTIKSILRYKPFLGLLLVLTIALPWYVLVHIETGGVWTKGFFLDHNIHRFGNEMEGHGGVFLITWAFVLLGMMPFSFFVIYAFIKAYKNRKDTLLQFSAIICVVFILFFSISNTKLPNYTMPCYPFLAFVISKALWEFFLKQKKSAHITVVVLLITVLAVALPIAGKFALLNEKGLENSSNISLWLLPTSLITTGGAFLYFQKRYKTAFITISSGWIILVPVLFLIIYPALTMHNPVEKAKTMIKDNKQIAAYKRFDAAFPINFRKTFTVLSNAEEIDSFFKKFPDGYLITNDRNVGNLDNNNNLTKVFEAKALFESHTTRIYKQQ